MILGTVLAPLTLFFAILFIYYRTKKGLPDFSESPIKSSFLRHYQRLLDDSSNST